MNLSSVLAVPPAWSKYSREEFDLKTWQLDGSGRSTFSDAATYRKDLEKAEPGHYKWTAALTMDDSLKTSKELVDKSKSHLSTTDFIQSMDRLFDIHTAIPPGGSETAFSTLEVTVKEPSLIRLLNGSTSARLENVTNDPNLSVYLSLIQLKKNNAVMELLPFKHYVDLFVDENEQIWGLTSVGLQVKNLALFKALQRRARNPQLLSAIENEREKKHEAGHENRRSVEIAPSLAQYVSFKTLFNFLSQEEDPYLFCAAIISIWTQVSYVKKVFKALDRALPDDARLFSTMCFRCDASTRLHDMNWTFHHGGKRVLCTPGLHLNLLVQLNVDDIETKDAFNSVGEIVDFLVSCGSATLSPTFIRELTDTYEEYLDDALLGRSSVTVVSPGRSRHEQEAYEAQEALMMGERVVESDRKTFADQLDWRNKDSKGFQLIKQYAIQQHAVWTCYRMQLVSDEQLKPLPEEESSPPYSIEQVLQCLPFENGLKLLDLLKRERKRNKKSALAKWALSSAADTYDLGADAQSKIRYGGYRTVQLLRRRSPWGFSDAGLKASLNKMFLSVLHPSLVINNIHTFEDFMLDKEAKPRYVYPALLNLTIEEKLQSFAATNGDQIIRRQFISSLFFQLVAAFACCKQVLYTDITWDDKQDRLKHIKLVDLTNTKFGNRTWMFYINNTTYAIPVEAHHNILVRLDVGGGTFRSTSESDQLRNELYMDLLRLSEKINFVTVETLDLAFKSFQTQALQNGTFIMRIPDKLMELYAPLFSEEADSDVFKHVNAMFYHLTAETSRRVIQNVVNSIHRGWKESAPETKQTPSLEQKKESEYKKRMNAINLIKQSQGRSPTKTRRRTMRKEPRPLESSDSDSDESEHEVEEKEEPQKSLPPRISKDGALGRMLLLSDKSRDDAKEEEKEEEDIFEDERQEKPVKSFEGNKRPRSDAVRPMRELQSSDEEDKEEDEDEGERKAKKQRMEARLGRSLTGI